MNISIVRISAVLGLCAALLGTSCNGQTSSGKGSETSWLTTCTSDADCRVGQCVCGTCTLPCDSNSACPGGADPDTCATSGSSAFSALCGAPVTGTTGICVSGCGGGTPCAKGFECVDGACLPSVGTVTSGVTGPRVMGPFAGAAAYYEATMNMLPGPLSGKCMPRSLDVAVDNSVPCTVLKYSFSGSCDCSQAGLRVAAPELLPVGRRILGEFGACGTDSTPPCDPQCACEVQPFGVTRTSCTQDTGFTSDTPGYCYVDPEQGIGDPSIVDQCPPNDRRFLRLGGPVDDSTYVVACQTLHVVQSASGESPGIGRIGAACVPSEEYDPSFSGYAPEEVAVDFVSTDCATGLCLVNHFRGRASCAYGQDPSAGASSENSCFTPDAARQLVTAMVDPQMPARRPEQAVYCSCRCDGADTLTDRCKCPTGFTCTPLVDDIGKGGAQLAGSYCVKTGTAVSNVRDLLSGPACARPNCGP